MAVFDGRVRVASRKGDRLEHVAVQDGRMRDKSHTDHTRQRPTFDCRARVVIRKPPVRMIAPSKTAMCVTKDRGTGCVAITRGSDQLSLSCERCI